MKVEKKQFAFGLILQHGLDGALNIARKKQDKKLIAVLEEQAELNIDLPEVESWVW